MTRDTYVYRYSDGERVIYVGMTSDMKRRHQSHMCARWNSDALSLRIKGPMHRSVAMELERKWVRRFNPTANVRLVLPDEPSMVESIVEDAGGKAAVCERLGISRQAIEQWRAVPALRVLEIEAMCSRYDRHDIRPDVFGASPVAAA